MQARLDEMHANDKKFREDLDAADKEKARLTQEHYVKLQQRETFIDSLHADHAAKTQRLNDEHGAEIRALNDKHASEIR